MILAQKFRCLGGNGLITIHPCSERENYKKVDIKIKLKALKNPSSSKETLPQKKRMRFITC